jgi:hypothetical protein
MTLSIGDLFALDPLAARVKERRLARFAQQNRRVCRFDGRR